jgi:hypothetical protein
MPAGFRHHPLSSDSSATSQISARQVDAVMEQTFKRDSRLRLNDTFEFSDELLAG